MSDYTTSIGLDVHARSIKGCAFNPYTGEVERRSFPYDPAAVADWALSFEAPRAVYESGVTGFHLCRELRSLGVDCVVGVSANVKPADSANAYPPVAPTNMRQSRQRFSTTSTNDVA